MEFIRRNRTALEAAGIAALVFIPYLGAVGLWDPWETNYAEAAREMIERGDLIHPHWESSWFFSKPVLALWLMVPGLWLTGAAHGAGELSPYTEWLEKWSDRDDRGDKITTRVECGEYFHVRDDALRAHATQVDPDGFWFRIPLELQQKVWPTEDFELARSLVDSPVPESDLFAGVHERVDAC